MVERAELIMDHNGARVSDPPASLSDEELFERYRSDRNPVDFEELVNRHQAWVYRVALAVCRNQALAEEAVQDLFMQLTIPITFKNMGTHSFRAWLYIRVRHVTLDCLKKERRIQMRERDAQHQEQLLRESHSASASPRVAAEETGSDALRAAVFGLSADLRIPIVLHFLEGLPQAEIGKLIGINQSQVSRRLSQGLDLLRKQLVAAGVSFSAAGLPGMLQRLPEFQVPAHLGTRLIQRVLQSGKHSQGMATTASQRIVHSTASRMSSFTWTVVLTLAAAAGLAAWIWIKLDDPRPSDSIPSDSMAARLVPLAEPEAPRIGILRHWDFNRPGHQQDFEVVQGAWHWVAHDGADGSGCMRIKPGGFMAKFEFSPDDLPLLIALRERIPKEGSRGGLTLSWTKFQRPMAKFENTGPLHVVDESEWLAHRFFVTDDFVVRYTNLMGSKQMPIEPSLILMARRRESSRLGIVTNWPLIVDNIEARTITPEEVPDIGKYLTALNEIPPHERVGTVVLEQFHSPQPGKNVYIHFDP